MSYVPKYILRRLVPSDGVKLDGDIVQIKFVNVLSPINVSEDEFPDDISGKVKLKLNGEEIPESTVMQTELIIEGDTIKITEMKKMQGKTIPVGSEILIRVPNTDNMVESGKSYKFAVWIEDTANLSLELERTVQ